MNTSLTISPICVSCDSCRLICPEDAVITTNNEYHIENWACTNCALCVLICPVDAIKQVDSSD